ncbi:Hypothetical protein CINCED_3A006680 [Cinara cedri]|uniref:Uncharacterized protein n=1 Tax=Cinara cedri TaxID=506608 RepID=A0A5E4MP73_9HEMI|nr:Hypothetical protein CINCED_3A006680 [Cinara cedri]
MVVFGYFPMGFFPLIVIVTLRSNEAIDIKPDRTSELNVDEQFLKQISRHYCNRLTGTHVVLLAEPSVTALFYKILLRSFRSTFYIHKELTGNFSASDYIVLFVEDERFFFEEINYNRRFWYTTKTYLIVSENELKTKILWSHVQRLWEDFKVFKISLLHSDNLNVLRIFDHRFYKHTNTTARKLNYGIHNTKKYPLKAVIFPRIPSIVHNERDGVWTGPDWLTLQAFGNHMNLTLDLNILSEPTGFGSLINGTYTGVLAEVAYGRADISFNSRFMNDPMINKAYRYSNSNGWDFICFVVPTAGPLSRLQILLQTFTFGVWLCVAVTYALMTKSFQLFNKFQLVGGGGDRKISDPFMTSIQVVLGMGVCSLPKHGTGRLLLVSCSAACFVLVSLFQASMVTKLSIESGQKDIDTFEELDQSGMEIRTSLKSVRDSLAMYSYTKSLANKIDLKKARRDYMKSKFVFTARIMSLNSGYANYVGHFQNDTVELHIVKKPGNLHTCNVGFLNLFDFITHKISKCRV